MRPIHRVLLLFLIISLLTGCSALSAEELYQLPEASEDYYDLQTALNGVLSEGYSYLAPASGARQEPVQLTDLDGDGTDEAVAFFRSTADSAVKVYVFSKAEGVYTPVSMIDGAGASVAAVEYADLDGEGDLEIVLTCQVSEAVTQSLQIYGYDENGAVNLLTDSCSRYDLLDLDDDGLGELLTLTTNGAETPATVKYYDMAEGQLQRSEELRLSYSYDGLRRVTRGYLADGSAAVMLSGVAGEGMLATDLFAVQDGVLSQIIPDEAVQLNSSVEGTYVYPADIDGDGVTELAQTLLLPGLTESSRVYPYLKWFEVNPQGRCRQKLVTYQSLSGNWYLTFPELWDGNVTVTSEETSAAVTAVTFNRLLPDAGGTVPTVLTQRDLEPILTIYTLRGSNRQKYAEENELTILRSDSEIIYAVDLNKDAGTWEGTITMAQVTEMFHLIDSGSESQIRIH